MPQRKAFPKSGVEKVYSAKSYWLLMLLTVAVAILGYWMFVITLAPMPATFEQASGRLYSAKANSRKSFERLLQLSRNVCGSRPTSPIERSARHGQLILRKVLTAHYFLALFFG